MSKVLFEKKPWKKIIIALEIVFLAGLCALALVTYRNSRPVAFKTSGVKVVSKDQGVDFKLERIEKNTDGGKDYISLKGWIVEKNVESRSSDTIKVVLLDINTGKCYSIPTTRQLRQTVTKQFYDGTNYDESGFEAKIQLGKEINESSEYQVLIYLKNKDGKMLADTQTGVFGWINSHQS